MFFEKNGKAPTTTSPCTSESSKVAVQMGHTLLRKAQSSLKEAGVSDQYWCEAMKHAAHFYNQITSGNLEMKTPYDSFLKKIPIISISEHLDDRSTPTYTRRLELQI